VFVNSVVTPCSSLKVYQHFGGTFCLHLHVWRLSRQSSEQEGNSSMGPLNVALLVPDWRCDIPEDNLPLQTSSGCNQNELDHVVLCRQTTQVLLRGRILRPALSDSPYDPVFLHHTRIVTHRAKGAQDLGTRRGRWFFLHLQQSVRRAYVTLLALTHAQKGYGQPLSYRMTLG
jgi:hypothetical protein